MKKFKAMVSTLLVAVVFFGAGFTSVSAEKISEFDQKEDTITSANIPLSINLFPRKVDESGVTSYTVTPKINWYDGVSNSFHVSYTNAYGQRQLSQTFYNYNVTVGPTIYKIPSGGTKFSGRHYASVSTNHGMATDSGTIELYRR